MVQTEEQYIYIYRVLADGCAFTVTDMSPKTLRKHFSSLRDSQRDGSTPLDSEFRRIAEGAQLGGRTDSGQLPVNKAKNRFQTILPLESSRVRLIPVPGVVGSDYINASFIDGFKHKNTYIAAQAPLADTIVDFWRMIWERETHSILMLTSEVVKQEQYWPEIKGMPSVFGEYEVYLMSEKNHQFAIERTLRVMDLVSETSREVKQWQYLEWAENRVPSNGKNFLKVVDMIETFAQQKMIAPRMDSIYGNAQVIFDDSMSHQIKPLVIHCNTGLGRTGTVCAILISIKRMMEEQKVDLYSTVKHLRTQRTGMVQTSDQYEFIYRVIVDWLDVRDAKEAQEAPRRPTKLAPEIQKIVVAPTKSSSDAVAPPPKASSSSDSDAPPTPAKASSSSLAAPPPPAKSSSKPAPAPAPVPIPKAEVKPVRQEPMVVALADDDEEPAGFGFTFNSADNESKTDKTPSITPEGSLSKAAPAPAVSAPEPVIEEEAEVFGFDFNFNV